jgi:hypothetical protein
MYELMYEFLIGIVVGTAVMGIIMAVLNSASKEDALMDDFFVRGLIEDVSEMDINNKEMLLSLKERANSRLREWREEQEE